MKEQVLLLFGTLFLCFFGYQLNGQDNFDVDFKDASSIPDFLNVCGESDTETIVIQVIGANPGVRTNVQATAHLFEGVQYTSFDPGNSTAGVALFDVSDPNNPIFTLPDLDPSGLNTVEISFSVVANCEYLDTLSANGAMVVFDTWELNYSIGGTPVQEFDPVTEYRDAFAVPFFSAGITNSLPFAMVGDCGTREITLTNSGLDGFVDTLIYENYQGSGIHITEIFANGIPLVFTKTATPGGDTLVTAVLDSTYFRNNTIGGLPGDGNPFIDPDESIVITEEYCVTSCDEDRSSDHSFSWGCYGRYCNTTSASDFVMLGQGSPLPEMEISMTTASVFAGYCQTGTSALTFRNAGAEVNPGFGTMFNVAMGVGLGGTLALYEERIEITSVTVAGVSITPVTNLVSLDNHPDFAVDPDGPGGLEDLDGDGFFDDIAINEEIEVQIGYEFDCSMALGADEDCANEFSVAFNARFDYDDYCLDRYSEVETSYFSVTNTRDSEEYDSDVDAFLQTDVFFVRAKMTRNVRNFERNCGGSEEFRVAVVLPMGVNPELGQIELVRNTSNSLPLLSNTISNDTLYLVFDATATAFLGGEYEIILAFRGDCTAAIGPTLFPTSLSFYCPTCDCEHLWFCRDLSGPVLHREDPPCTPTPCPVGIQTLDFEVNRTTFGYTDNTYTTPFDPNSANKKVAISCDSVEMIVTSVIGDTPLNDSIGVQITYDNPNNILTLGEIFLFSDADIRIVSGGTTYNCTIDPTSYSYTDIDGSKTMRFDLHDCLTGLGITLAPGDSLIYEGHFALNPDGPFDVNFYELPNFRGSTYGTVEGTDYDCDNFGERFFVAKTQNIFAFPSSSSFPDGCEETFLQYRLITRNNGFTNFFGAEARQAFAVDSMVFDFDTLITDAFIVVEPQVSIPGHPIHGSDFFDMPSFDEFPDGRYVARFDTLVSVPSLNQISSYGFNFRVRLIPNCQSQFGSTDGDNRYNFDPALYYQDRYYANSIGDGSCTAPVVETRDNDIIYDDQPEFSITTLTNPTAGLLTDTATWIVQVCNTSFAADAGGSWISLEDPDSVIQLVGVELVDDPANPVDLPISTYGMNGANGFTVSEGLSRAGSGNSLEQRCNNYLLKALVEECGTADATASFGWNCLPYTDTLFNPMAYPPCSPITIDLQVSTFDPFIDANIINQPAGPVALCDTVILDILVRNTDVGSLFDLRSEFVLPYMGATLVSGGMGYAYPPSAPFQPMSSDPVFVETTMQGDVYEYADFTPTNSYLIDNGLMGFDASNPTDSNEIVIRYRFVMDCEFTGGALTYYQFQGQKGCGDPSNIEAGESLPIFIDDGGASAGRQFDISFVNSSLIADGINDVTIEVVNTGTVPTTVDDLIRLRFVDTIPYINGSSQGILPGGYMPGEPTMNTDAGFQFLRWPMPIGLNPGETAQLTFQLDIPDLDCSDGDILFELYNLVRTNVTCNVASCPIEVITSSNPGQLVGLPVDLSGLQIEILSLDGNCSGTNETGTVTGQFVNESLDLMGNTLTLNYYYDTDNNGSTDVGEPIIDTYSGMGPVAIGDTLGFSHVINPSAAQWCNIIAVLDTTGLGLCGQPQIAISQTPNLMNAGADILFCAPQVDAQTFALGEAACSSLAGYAYNWTAISPASTADLSSTTIPNPTLSLSHDGMQEDTLYYVLETIRPGCGISSTDTIQVIRSVAPIVDAGLDVYIENGQSYNLNPTVTGGQGPLTYAWVPSASLSDSSLVNPVATPNVDTEYILTVTSATGCTAIDTINIFIGAPFDAEVNVSDTIICEGSGLQLVATGGDAYAWQSDPSNPSNAMLSDTAISNPFFSGGLAGEVYQYEVIVTDSVYPLVADTAQVRVEIAANPVVVTSFPDTNNCDANLILVSFELSNPISSFEITTTDGIYSNPTIVSTNTLEFAARADIAPASFDILFTDNNGCTVMDGFTIDPCDDPVDDCDSTIVSGVSVISALCGQTTGIAEIELSEPLSNYTFTWTPDEGISNAPGNRRMNLPVGVYMVDIQNNANPSCSVTQMVLVGAADGPQAMVSATTPATCQNADGSVTIMPMNYDYTWSDGGLGNARTNLAAGDYIITVTDPNNPVCEDYLSVTVEENNPLTAGVVVGQTSTCGQLDGAATLSVAGGSGSYTYLWPDGSTAVNNTILSSGGHTVTVTDANTGCILEVSVFIPDDKSGATLANVMPTAVTCGGDSNGSVDFLVAYTGTFSAPADTIITDGNTVYENGQLAPGDYCLFILDADGCLVAGDCFEILEADPVEVTVDAVPDCGAGGSIAVSTTGQDPFTYDWGDIPGTNDIRDRTGLANSSYFLTVTDAASCSMVMEVTIDEDNCPCLPPSINLTSIYEANCGESNGGIAIYPEGDENAFVYTWTPDIGTGNITGNERIDLPAGIYNIVVTDTLSTLCQAETTVVIPNTDGPQVDNMVITASSCAAADGTAMLSPDTLNYTWSDGGTGANRTGLAPGNYYVTIEDPTQPTPTCPNYLEVTVDSENDLSATVTINSQPFCGIIDFGSATISVAGGSGNYEYSWGSGTATNDSLLAGAYLVTVTDVAGGGCSVEVPILMLHSGVTIDVTITDTTHLSCFGDTNGAIEFDVNFGANPSIGYDTLIITPDGTEMNGMLTGGNYCLIVSDPTGCLQGGACFTIEEPEDLEATVIVEQDCLNGSFVEVLPEGGTAPYLIDWADIPGMDDPPTRTVTEGNTYQLTITDLNGCILSEGAVAIPVCSSDSCEYFGGLDEITIQTGCGFGGELCLDIPLGQQGNYEITVDGTPYAGTIDGCAFDTLVVYSYTDLFGQGDLGPYEVTSWNIGGTIFTGVFQDIPALVDSMNIWDPMGNWSSDTLAQTISGGSPGLNYGFMEINATLFGTSSTLGANFAFFPRGFSIVLSENTQEVVIRSLLNGCADTLIANVFCTNIDTIYEEIIVNTQDTICLDASELPGNIDTIYNYCPGSVDDVTITFLPDTSCFILDGLTVGMDTACMVVCDDLGFCDTTIVIIDVLDNDQTVIDTIFTGVTETYCIDTTLLNLIGAVDTIYNGCPELSDGNVEFDIQADSYCVDYTGLEIGTDTACIVLCDTFGFCDTVDFYITVIDDPFNIVDTIMVDEEVTYCIDTSILTIGAVDTIYNDCPDFSGDEVVFEIDPDSLCITYTGIDIGVDTACIVLCDSLDNCDTLNITVVVIPDNTGDFGPDWFVDTVYINQTEIHCVDTIDLPGNIVSIENVCPDVATGDVDFDLNPFDYCVSYTGDSLGVDTACIVICDDLGNCDTTYFAIYVVEFFDLPNLNDDYDTTSIGTPVVINIKSNDSLFGGIDTVYILDEPIYGTASINLDCSATYIAGDEFCEREDQFTYVACNPIGCDTATVYVYITCEDIVIFNAVSANDDGVNDTFFVSGIEDYPDNVLRIYNRWGNLVYSTTGYQNDWRGTYNNELALPDGTYFYLLELNDEDGRVFSGYLELYR